VSEPDTDKLDAFDLLARPYNETLCQHCEDWFDQYSHVVEAFETTGKIICESCWNHFCEENHV